MEKIFVKNVCPRCAKGPVVTDTANGELCCTNCGYVVEQRREELGKEWRDFADDERNRNRVGAPFSLAKHDMGLNTNIGLADKDSTGNEIAPSMKMTMSRLRTWDSRSKIKTPAERNLSHAFSELSKLTDKLALNEMVIEQTAYIYRKVVERGLVRGRSILSFLAATLYAACRNTETPRSLNDIATASGVKRKDVARCYRLLLKELELQMPIVDPVKSIAKIASKARISEKSKRKALEIVRMAVDSKVSAGKGPMGLAATALYIACVINKENVTQKDLAEAAGVTEVTIRNRFKGLRTELKIMI